jgi:sugar phosphate isomerase/epimerase
MRAEPLEITLKRIKRLGFESIEISGEPQQYTTKASARSSSSMVFAAGVRSR